MKKIIRTNNLQKALEDYDALRGQTVSYVSVLPVSPNIRNCVYCKQSTTDVEDERNLTVGGLIENFAQETETENRFVIPATYTITYTNTVVKGIEVSGNDAIMYEDDDFTVVLGTVFNLEDSYTFGVTTHVTEMAYFVGDIVNQELHPVVSFGVIAEVNKRIDVVERELDTKADVSALVQLDTKIDNNYNTLDNKIDNSYNVLDAKIDNNYNVLDAKIDNEISNLAVNFTTDNLVANVATVNSASIDNAQVNNFDVSSIIANGSTGTDGQVLGKVNGNVEWFSPSLDTNDFEVNYLTVNNNSVTDNATINNLVVNNAILPRNINAEVSYTDIHGNPANTSTTSYLERLSGFGNPGVSNENYNFQFLPFIIMTESEYNNSKIGGNATYSDSRGYAYRNITSDPVFPFVATAPFGNIYFAGKKIADANCDVKVEKIELISDFFEGMLTTTASTASLVFTDVPVTNNFSFYVNAKVTSVLGSDVFNKSRENLPYGIDVNTDNGVLTTNVRNTYFKTFDSLFSGSSSMTDCFITNPSLILNAPSGYNVWNNITSASDMFAGCTSFNQPITIPNSVTAISSMFSGCTSFNQPVAIPNSVRGMTYLFSGCTSFNQPVTIPNSVRGMTYLFSGCTSFNQPVTIPNSVTDTSSMFRNCTSFNQPITIPNSVRGFSSMFRNCNSFNQPVTIPDGVKSISTTFEGCTSFNQPVTIPNSVTDMRYSFHNCTRFNQPVTIPNGVTDMVGTFTFCYNLASSTVPIHISHEIALGDTSNYIYNMLINGSCGIAFNPSRILNDA